MTFMESAIAMNTDFIECHNSLGRIQLFAEASYSDYQINLKEVALKVLKENGTEDDYNFLATEAAKDYIERAKKSIAKIIETIVKFIRNCKEKLVSLFASEKTSNAVDKLESACEKNPKIRSKKIEYEDTDKRVKTIQKGIDDVKKRVSKVEARGYATEDDVSAINDIAEDTKKKVGAIVAATTITLGAAAVLLKKFNNKSDVENMFGNEEDQITQPKDNMGKDPLTANFFVKSAQTIGSLLKDKAQMIIAAPISLINKIKGNTASENIEGDNEDTKTESVNIEDLPMFKIVTENCAEESVEEPVETEETTETVETESVMTLGEVEGLDLDAYFTELCNDLFTESEDESNTETTEVDTPAEESVEATTEEAVAESTDDNQIEETPCKETPCDEQPETEVPSSDENVTEESAEETANEDLARTYMEQLEHELFGESENVVQEETADTTVVEEESTEITDSAEVVDAEPAAEEVTDTVETESATDVVNETYQSLLDEMEALLDD